MYVHDRSRSGRVSRLALSCAAIAAITSATPSAAAVPSSGPPAPVCGNGDPPPWVKDAHDPNDGVPDPQGRIVFGEAAGMDDMGQLVTLYAVDPDGSDLVQLLDCKVERPRISPDGRRIAFGIAMDDHSHQVATMNIDGSDLRLLTSTPGFAAFPDWSPDGSWLSYSYEPIQCPDPDCAKEGGFHLSLWRMDADGSNQRLIGDPARAVGATHGMPVVTQDAEARLSPDSTRIVFNRIDAPDYIYHLMIRDLTTGKERMATGSARGEEHPEWSRDGGWIIYNTDDESDPKAIREQIERLPADDATAVPVVIYPSDASHLGYKPTYSPDGTSIAFMCEGNVCRMDADGSNVHVIVRAHGTELNHVAWGITPPAGP